jgi:ubiquinone/menaquinone biosynthesis C-methylase UbiE
MGDNARSRGELMIMKKNNVDSFERTADRYYSTFNGIHAKKITDQMINRVKGKMDKGSGAMLDVGCGTGTLIKNLNAANDDWEYHGIDLSKKMIQVCNSAKAGNETFSNGNAESLPYPEARFDIVTCTDSFHHYANPETALSEMYRVLKKEGCLVMSEIWLPILIRQITNAMLKILPVGDVHVYSRKELSRLMENVGFKKFRYEIGKNFSYTCQAKKE